MQNNTAIDKNSREYQENLYKGSRSNLLLVLIFTVVNLVMLLTDSGSYWLFSAAIPYYLTLFGYVFDGGIVDTYTTTALVISAVILVVYLASWLLSKKRSGWLTVAAVLFVLDTVCMLGLMVYLELGIGDMLMDLIFHGWVVFSLVRGCMAAKKLKEMPEEPEIIVSTGPELDQ